MAAGIPRPAFLGPRDAQAASREKLIRHLRKSYRDVTVLRMLEHVRGEEDVEVMQRGLTDFFELKP